MSTAEILFVRAHKSQGDTSTGEEQQEEMQPDVLCHEIPQVTRDVSLTTCLPINFL